MLKENSLTTRVVVGLVGLAAAVFMLGLTAVVAPATAHGQTTAELQAQIQSLLATISALQAQLSTIQGGSGGWACPAGGFTMSMGIGASGPDARQLQVFLNSNADTRVAATGPGSPGQETSYYGPLTRAAVSNFHAKFAAQILAPLGLTAPTGYWGQSSIKQANTLCTQQPSPTPPADDDEDEDEDEDTELRGGAGAINDADLVSSLNNEEVGEGADDVEVAGLDIEADEGSDIELTAVKLNFSQGTADRDFRRYADDVSVWFNGEEVARVDARDFTDNNNFDRTVSLDRGAIIRAGDTERLVVAVSGLANIDSNDEGETWTVAFDSVRFRDAQGAVISDTSTGDMGTTRTFSFESFSTSADTKLKFSLGDASINDQRVIDVDANNDTNNVDFFSFMIEVEGNSDVVLDDLPLTYTAVGSDVDHIINSAELWIDGNLVDTLNIPTSATTSSQLTFDNFDYTLEAGEKVEAIVRVDINDLDSNFEEGDTLLIKIGENETDHGDFDAEDEEGNDLSDSEVTGSATTDAHTFYDNSFNISLVSTEATVSKGNAQASESDQTTFKIVYDVTAFGSDIYLGTSTAVATTTTAAPPEVGVNYEVLINGSLDTDATSTAIITMSNKDTDGTTGAFKVEEGTTDRFTLTVNLQASEDNFFEIQIGSLGWSADTDATADEHGYTFGLDDFDAGPVFMDAR